jgi:hypothetical protein
VYQARNAVPEFGLISTVMPWPEVAGSYQFPESEKSAFTNELLVGEHVTLRIKRVNAMVPLALPSSNRYDSTPLVHESKLSKALPTACAVVIGGALKLPPMF